MTHTIAILVLLSNNHGNIVYTQIATRHEIRERGYRPIKGLAGVEITTVRVPASVLCSYRNYRPTHT